MLPEVAASIASSAHAHTSPVSEAPGTKRARESAHPMSLDFILHSSEPPRTRARLTETAEAGPSRRRVTPEYRAALKPPFVHNQLFPIALPQEVEEQIFFERDWMQINDSLQRNTNLLLASPEFQELRALAARLPYGYTRDGHATLREVVENIANPECRAHAIGILSDYIPRTHHNSVHSALRTMLKNVPPGQPAVDFAVIRTLRKLIGNMPHPDPNPDTNPNADRIAAAEAHADLREILNGINSGHPGIESELTQAFCDLADHLNYIRTSPADAALAHAEMRAMINTLHHSTNRSRAVIALAPQLPVQNPGAAHADLRNIAMNIPQHDQFRPALLALIRNIPLGDETTAHFALIAMTDTLFERVDEALVELADNPPPRNQAAAHTAIRHRIARLTRPAAKVHLLGALAANLPQGDEAGAHAALRFVAENIQNEHWRAEAIRLLAVHSPPGQEFQVHAILREMAARITNGVARGKAIAGLASALPPRREDEVFERLVAMTENLRSPQGKAIAIGGLAASQLGRRADIHARLRAMAYRIDDGNALADALGFLAKHTVPGLAAEIHAELRAIAAADNLLAPAAKARAIGNLSRHLPRGFAIQAYSALCEIFARIPDEIARAEATTPLAAALSQFIHTANYTPEQIERMKAEFHAWLRATTSSIQDSYARAKAVRGLAENHPFATGPVFMNDMYLFGYGVSDRHVRSRLLETLNAEFFISATNAHERARHYVAEMPDQQQRLDFFFLLGRGLEHIPRAEWDFARDETLRFAAGIEDVDARLHLTNYLQFLRKPD